MPRLSSFIVDSLALVMVCVSLTSIVVGYGQNLPDPAAQFRQVAGTDDDWLDPVTTGAITPKEKSAAAGRADAQAGPRPDVATQSTVVGSRAWVDPPRR